MRLDGEAWRTGPRAYLAAVEAELTPNLQTRERFGQDLLSENRVRMRGAEDPPSPFHHVLHYGHGFEQVVACVGIDDAAYSHTMIQTQVVASASGVIHEGIG